MKSVVFSMKNKVFQGSAASLFRVVSMFFQTFFDIDFCIDFVMILGAVLAPFSVPFRPWGHHFEILFQFRFFHDFSMPFLIIFGPI